MRNRLAWVLGGLGVAAALRALRREPASTPVAEPVPVPDDRADELRRKLEESRTIIEERDAFEDGETPVDEAEPVPASPEDRRKQVYERARSTADHMRRSTQEE